MLLLLFTIIFCFLLSIYGGGSLMDGFVDRCSLKLNDLVLLFDDVSLVCLMMLFCCGATSLFFSNHYFGNKKDGYILSLMLFVFLSVMGVLVLTYSFLGTLMMWEYLGAVSFFLILFYGNLDSLRATLMTIFASRFGDICLFGCWLFFVSWFLSFNSMFFIMLVLFIVLTKSASFPFVSWLLEAMRAPTPVSSLVHSSTLVAAGVWFLFRYGKSILCCCPKMDVAFFLLCLVSIIMSSFCSLVFLDLKKIMALSTCKKISWCIVFFMFGDIFLGLFQLLCHGVSKCFLFVSLGDLMSFSGSTQDSRGVFCSSYNKLFLVVVQCILVLSLSGLPFMGVFFMKHLLISELSWSFKVVCFFLMFIGFFISYAYSTRLLFLLSGFFSFNVYSFGCFFIFMSFFPLMKSIFGFLSCFSSIEIFLAGFLYKMIIMVIQILGFLFGIYFYFFATPGKFSLWCFLLWGCDVFVSIFYYIYSSLFYLFLFCLYRWEVFLCSFFDKSYMFGGNMVKFGWLSLKFLLLSGFVCIFLFLM